MTKYYVLFIHPTNSYDETDNISCKISNTKNQVNPFDLKEIDTKKDDGQSTKPKFSDAEITKFKQLSEDPFIYDILADSLGYLKIKNCLL